MKSLINLFVQKSYKSYLKSLFGQSSARSGQKARAAKAMECQMAYLSRVLNGDAELSLEQAMRLSEFLNHTADEKSYFLLLVQRDRAGTKTLREYFQQQLDVLISQRQEIQSRVRLHEELSLSEQSKYYSRWYYSSIHVIISIPSLRSVESIANYLQLNRAVVSEALGFLQSCGLVEEINGLFHISKRHIHIGNKSENIQKHHNNWRVKAMSAMDIEKPGDLHYSVVFTLSREDAVRLKENLMRTIEENLKIVGPSNEEVVFCQCLDFFELAPSQI